jgi:hypothetical protein
MTSPHVGASTEELALAPPSANSWPTSSSSAPSDLAGSIALAVPLRPTEGQSFPRDYHSIEVRHVKAGRPVPLRSPHCIRPQNRCERFKGMSHMLDERAYRTFTFR